MASNLITSAGLNLTVVFELHLDRIPILAAEDCQLRGLSPSGQRILRPKTLKSLWEDSLVPYGRKE